MANKFYVGDYGTDIIVDVGESIILATATKINYKKPDGTTGQWDGVVYLNNYIKYTVQDGDWDQAGDWYINAYVEMAAWTGRGETDSFTLYDPFEI